MKNGIGKMEYKGLGEYHGKKNLYKYLIFKVNLKTGLDMEMAYLNIQTKISTLDNGKMGKSTAKEPIFLPNKAEK